MPCLQIDNSKRSCFATCPRKYYYQYIRHLQPKKYAEPLIFGKVYHRMQEAYRILTKKGISHNNKITEAIEIGLKLWLSELNYGYIIDEESYRTFDNCVEVFMKYFEFFPTDIIPKETEYFFSEKLFTEGDYDVHFAGKIDCIGHLAEGEELAIFDDKTTSYNINLLKSQFSVSPQLIGYTWITSKLKNIKTVSAIVNIAFMKSLKSGLTIEHDRVIYVYNENDFLEWHKSLIDTAERILKATKSGNFPVQLDSCYGKYGACSFLNLCSSPLYNEGYIQENFIEREWKIYED